MEILMALVLSATFFSGTIFILLKRIKTLQEQLNEYNKAVTRNTTGGGNYQKLTHDFKLEKSKDFLSPNGTTWQFRYIEDNFKYPLKDDYFETRAKNEFYETVKNKHGEKRETFIISEKTLTDYFGLQFPHTRKIIYVIDYCIK